MGRVATLTRYERLDHERVYQRQYHRERRARLTGAPMPQSADHPYRQGPKRAPTLPTLDPHIDPVERKVRTIIADSLGMDLEDATLDKALLEDLGADSLDVVELTMDLEAEFGIVIDEDDSDRFVRVKDVVNHVRRHTR